MLSSLTVKPLLWATGVLALLLAASSALNVRQFKQLGAVRAECELRVSNESADRSQATTTLEAESLRSKIAALELELLSLQEINKAVQLRHTESALLLNEYRKQLNEARAKNPDLDQPVDTSRLRALQNAYRVRAHAGGDSQVPSNP